MTVERAILAFAGLMVLLSVLLTYYVHQNFVWLTVFVGANLFQFGFSNVCPMGWMLRKLGVPDAAPCSTTSA